MRMSPFGAPRWARVSAKLLPAVLVGVLALTCAYPGSGRAAESGRAAQRGSVRLSGSPGSPVSNPRTDTVYVPIQCAKSYCPTSGTGRVVDVIDGARCNERDVSGCRVLATVQVGKDPTAAVLDPRTDTIYVVNGGGTVSVINGARCNATVTRGCARAIATVTTAGGFTVAGAVDPATRTLYVADLKGAVFAVDIARCNAITTSGCDQPVRRIADRAGPDAVAVDVPTDTVYAANAGLNGNGSGDTVSVIDGARCNASDGRGCDRAPHTVKVGSNPEWDIVDQATNTVYVANYNAGTVSVIDGARCNARVSAGCRRTPKTVSTGAGTNVVAIDNSDHTVFALNGGDDTLSAINTLRCTGARPGDCPTLAPAQQAGSDQGSGYTGFPIQLALLPHTGSAYLVNEGGENVLDVADVDGCDAIDTAACRHDASTVTHDHEFLATIDPATDTIYASSTTAPQIDVLDGATCQAGQLSGCAPVAEIPIDTSHAFLGAIDDVTHTLYASGASSVSVINTATCNATTTTGCSAKPPTIPIGTNPSIPTLNPTTHTLYLAFGKSEDRLAVINAATCNALIATGCGQTPGVTDVGIGTRQLGISTATNTIYAPSGGANFSGDSVAVINGATCDAADLSGCGKPAATVKAGAGPDAVAVNDLTHTVYVANNADGDAPGTVSVINSATCNGTDIVGCTSPPIATVAVGRAPLLAALDTTTDQIYVNDFAGATVSVIDGSTCNAAITTGCSHPAAAQAVGSSPFGLAVDADTNTVYAFTTTGAATSIFAGPLQ
jgi:DNA-binding beta-propeller fold protein YncE